MKPVSFTNASGTRELDHFRRIFEKDSLLENEFKQLQTTGRIPPSGNLLLRHSGLDFRKRADRLVGLYLFWNTKFLRWLIEEELLESIEKFENDSFLRIAEKASLENCQYFETHFFQQFSPRDFFGNFAPRVETLLRNLYLFRSLPPNAKRKIRRRGYPTSVRRQLRIHFSQDLHKDFTIKWPDSEAQMAEENCRLCEKFLLLSLIQGEKQLRAGTQ